jgi:pSer/pThr/pTyr-binding forkhead associated (FHA) protein
MTIGRHSDNAISIDDARISRHHVRLTRRGNGVQVEDMGSANGTFVNNSRISGPVLLREGDTIGLSQDIILRFTHHLATDDATVLVPSRPAAVITAPPPAAAPPKAVPTG